MAVNPRTYQNPDGGTELFRLRQDDDAQWQIYDPAYWDAPAIPEFDGPWNGVNSPAILDRNHWNNYIALNTWHSFRLVLGTDGISHLYVDNAQVGSSTVMPNYSRTGNWTLMLGNFNGDVDELRISNATQ